MKTFSCARFAPAADNHFLCSGYFQRQWSAPVVCSRRRLRVGAQAPRRSLRSPSCWPASRSALEHPGTHDAAEAVGRLPALEGVGTFRGGGEGRGGVEAHDPGVDVAGLGRVGGGHVRGDAKRVEGIGGDKSAIEPPPGED